MTSNESPNAAYVPAEGPDATVGNYIMKDHDTLYDLTVDYLARLVLLIDCRHMYGSLKSSDAVS